MKMLVTGLLVLAVSVVAALVLKQDNGYVLIGYDRWTVEGSLALFLLIILALFIVLYLLLRLWIRLWHAPREMRDWRGRRGEKRAQKALTLGLTALSEGHWKRAEKGLIRHVNKSQTPLLNYLAAARSAQQQGAHQRRDRYLYLAGQSERSADLAVGLTQAELQLEAQQLKQAEETLDRLRERAPHNLQVLRLQKELYQKSEAWQALYQLLPELKKQELLDQAEQSRLESRVFRNLLDSAAASEEPDRLVAIWKGFPPAARSDEALIISYANHLLSRGETVRVETLLRNAVGSSWSDTLVELYGRLETEEGVQQLATAEGWLEQHPTNPVLLLALGRLCIKGRLWGKARSYLEASIGAGPTPTAYQELGALLERLEEPAQALACFRTGLALSNEALPGGISAALPAGSPTDDRSLPAGRDDSTPPRLTVAELK